LKIFTGELLSERSVFNLMKNRFFTSIVVFLAVLPTVGWTLENTNVNDPVGSATVPPSSSQSGLIASPNPIDSSANMVVTGNVGGGKHFRGVVPYNAITDFGGTLGSTSLDPFLRYSSGGQYSGSYSGGLTPFYSQTGTVTRLSPGSSVIFTPPTASVSGGPEEGFALPQLPKRESLSYSNIASLPFLKTRPMGMTKQDIEKTLSSDIQNYPRGGMTAAEQLAERQKVTEEYIQNLREMEKQAAELRTTTPGEEKIQQPAGVPELIKNIQPLFERQPQEKDAGKERKPDVYEQMEQEVGKFRESLEALSIEKGTKDKSKDQKQEGLKDSEKGMPGGKKPQEKKLEEEKSFEQKLADLSLSAAKAKAILGEQKTFASLSESKFNWYLKEAENYLKQGKYYRAADAYTMASIYKPRDPLVYAGKSHALFAAGEYMSSALFLSRALEIFPEYAWFKIDILAMVGDKDQLESRIGDVEQWLKLNDAAELRFLLGYVYYQTGRLEKAKESIDLAYEKMPDSTSVIVLRKAIDDTIKSSQPIR